MMLANRAQTVDDGLQPAKNDPSFLVVPFGVRDSSRGAAGFPSLSPSGPKKIHGVSSCAQVVFPLSENWGQLSHSHRRRRSRRLLM